VLKSLVILPTSCSLNVQFEDRIPLDTLTMTGKGKQLTAANRKAAYYMIVAMSDDDGPQRGAFNIAASFFDVLRQAVAKMWRQINENVKKLEADHGTANDENNVFLDSTFESRIGDRRRGKHKHDREALKAAIKALPSNQCRKCRHLSAKVNVPISTLHEMLKSQKFLKRHSSTLKPKLTTSNKHLRMMHCLDHINPVTINSRTQPMKHQDLFDEVHVDEKLFYVSRDGESYITCFDEEPPEREVGHKSHITKVMFLCAQARPRLLHNGVWWDGKIGIWPVGCCRAAQRASVNRPAGTLLFKNETIDMDKCRSMLINDVVPAMLNE